MNIPLRRSLSLIAILAVTFGGVACHEEDQASPPLPAASTNSPAAQPAVSPDSSPTANPVTSPNDAQNPPNAPKPGTPSPTPATSNP